MLSHRFSRDLADRDAAKVRSELSVKKLSDDTLHRCETCNRTELSDPELEFRVTADGHEYCTYHLGK